MTMNTLADSDFYGPASLGDDSAAPRGGVLAASPPVVLQLWNIVLRRKWLLIAVVATALVLGLTLTLLATPKYTATTRLEISRERQNVTKVEGVDPDKAGQDVEFFQTQYSLLEARSLAERVAKQLRLANDEKFLAGNDVSPEEEVPTTAINVREVAELQSRKIVDILLDHLSVRPIRGSALVDVEYTSADPVLSAKIANTWAEQFRASSADRRFASTADARAFLESRLQELRERLEKSERQATAYAAEKDIVTLAVTRDTDGNITSSRTLISSELEQLAQALNQARAERIEAESRARAGSTPSAMSNNTALSALRERRANLAADLNRLNVQFEPGYPQVRALSEQIKAIDESIRREESRMGDSRQREYRAALDRENQLQQQVNALRSRLSTQEGNSIQYNMYKRDAETNRQLYDALLQRYKEIGVAGVEASNIAIIDPARVPERPSSPNLPLNLALSLILGLAAAVAIALILEQIDEGLREPSNVQKELGLPLLGSVLATENGYEEVQDIKSQLSEAYLTIRSNLAFATSHGLPRSIVITSARPAEGKTTSSFALAYTLGRSGKRVLLIDADMRSPSLAKMMDVPNTAGLSNYLAGADDKKSLIVSTPEVPFDLLPAGPMPPSAGELLSSDRLSRLIAELGETYDNVVIDAPPLLGLADGPLISRSVEGVIMVIEAGGVSVRGLRIALARLTGANANMLGAILTKLDANQAGYGYGYGYGYGSGYQYGKEQHAE